MSTNDSTKKERKLDLLLYNELRRAGMSPTLALMVARKS